MRWLLIPLVAVLLSVTADAQPRKTTFEALTVAGTAVGLAAATYTGMAHCQGRVETAAIRFRLDGPAPTASVGVPLAIGDILLLDDVRDAQAIRFIAQSGSAVLSVWCWPQS